MTILRKLLRALHIFLEQIMRLRELCEPFHQRTVIRNERFHTQRDPLDAEYGRRAVGEWGVLRSRGTGAGRRIIAVEDLERPHVHIAD